MSSRRVQNGGTILEITSDIEKEATILKIAKDLKMDQEI
jgi:hypothetical protein